MSLKKLVAKFEPIDVIAIIIILSCVTLIGFGRDGIITSILLMVTGFYFGRRTTTTTESE